MKKDQIIRAWTDPAYRAALSPEELASLPASPAGPTFADLDETDLQQIVAGNSGFLCTETAECADSLIDQAICGAWSFFAC